MKKVLAVTAGSDAAAVFFLGNELYIEERFRGRMPYFGCQCFEALYERCAHWVPDREALLQEHIHDVRKLNFFFHETEEWRRCGELFREMPVEFASGIPNNFEITAPGVRPAPPLPRPGDRYCPDRGLRRRGQRRQHPPGGGSRRRHGQRHGGGEGRGGRPGGGLRPRRRGRSH